MFIVNPAVPGGVRNGCTASSKIVIVEGLVVSPRNVPRVTASTGLLDDPQGSGISPDDPIRIGLNAPLYVDPSNAPNLPSSLPRNMLLDGTFDLLPHHTFEPLPHRIFDPLLHSTFTPLPDGTFDPLHSRKKRAPPPAVEGQQAKRQRREANTNPSVSVRGALERPQGMSNEEYVKALSEKLEAAKQDSSR